MAQDRIALVVGNSAYQDTQTWPALPNARNDAALIGERLATIGFQVITVTDADHRRFEAALGAFEAEIKAAADPIVLFYFAGHGLEAGGENILLPVDFRGPAHSASTRRWISFSRIFSVLNNAGTTRNIIVLDACRSEAGGFSAITNQAAPSGTFIAYATAPGMTASDGQEANSPFAAALARHLVQPGLYVGDIFNRVGANVKADTTTIDANGQVQQQVPWNTSSLHEQVTLGPGGDREAALQRSMEENERLAWEGIQDSDSPERVADYLRLFPSSPYRLQAEQLRAALIDARNLRDREGRIATDIVFGLLVRATTFTRGSGPQQVALKVEHVEATSPLFGQVAVGDYVVAVNGWTVDDKLDPNTALRAMFDRDRRLQLVIHRGQATYMASFAE